jgi:hypothetical protein
VSRFTLGQEKRLPTHEVLGIASRPDKQQVHFLHATDFPFNFGLVSAEEFGNRFLFKPAEKVEGKLELELDVVQVIYEFFGRDEFIGMMDITGIPI